MLALCWYKQFTARTFSIFVEFNKYEHYRVLMLCLHKWLVSSLIKPNYHVSIIICHVYHVASKNLRDDSMFTCNASMDWHV